MNPENEILDITYQDLNTDQKSLFEGLRNILNISHVHIDLKQIKRRIGTSTCLALFIKEYAQLHPQKNICVLQENNNIAFWQNKLEGVDNIHVTDNIDVDLQGCDVLLTSHIFDNPPSVNHIIIAH
jgi:hypothetical protein